MAATLGWENLAINHSTTHHSPNRLRIIFSPPRLICSMDATSSTLTSTSTFNYMSFVAKTIAWVIENQYGARIIITARNIVRFLIFFWTGSWQFQSLNISFSLLIRFPVISNAKPGGWMQKYRLGSGRKPLFVVTLPKKRKWNTFILFLSLRC